MQASRRAPAREEEFHLTHPRRLPAIVLTALFLATAAAPLAGASTEQTFHGDVVVNGAFADATPAGHPLKANDPATKWAAFDWVAEASAGATGAFTPGESGGITLVKTDGLGDVGVQQYFNGSFATHRRMGFFGLSVTASATEPGTYLSVQIRHDGAAGRVSASKALALTATPTTYKVSAAELGFERGADSDLVSVRLLTSGLGKPVHVERVSVFATNGVEGRNLHVVSTGDDALVPVGGAAILGPGADGKYSFLVGMAADTGDFLPTRDAWVCLYDAERALADRGYPDNLPNPCQGAFLGPSSPAIVKTREGAAFRFDVDARAVQSAATGFAAFALYATVEVDGSYAKASPAPAKAWHTGYFHTARLAADAANAGVSLEYFGPTPLFVDRDSDGVPDAAQLPETDGYSVIITPQLATSTPLATIVTPGTDGDYVFDVQVYNYTGGLVGAPMTLEHGIAFGLFGGDALVNGGAVDATPFWEAGAGDMRMLPDGKTVRVTVPGGEVPTTAPFGASAFYYVSFGEPGSVPATGPVWGRSTPAFDFHSALRNAVKEFAVADALRSAMTPLLADAASYTRDATLVIRMDADADELTPVDGTLVVGDKADGTVTFEYAMVLPEGRTLVPDAQGGHALALYDAGGVASDGLQPGSRRLAHAEFVGQGALQPDGWFRLDVPVSAFAGAKGAVGAWAYVDAKLPDGHLLSRSGYYNLLKPAVASQSTSAAEAALYGPTPLVILDEQLGIPRALASAVAGAPSGVASWTNPLANPGFEADLLVEGVHDNGDAASGAMTSPPWFLRLDDRGQGFSTDAASVHEVAPGAGQLGDAALRVDFQAADRGKGLMLGQLLGTEEGSQALAWTGATGAAFDVKTGGHRAVAFTASVRYVDADGAVRLASGRASAQPLAAWQRVEVAFPQPATGRLLGFYLQPDTPESTTFHLDNVVLKGAKTALGDARSDLSDGYAVVIEPRGLVRGVQGVTQGVHGGYYVYNVTVMDYTDGTPGPLDTGALAKSFALRTPERQLSTGVILPLRGETGRFAAVVPVEEAPARAAAPWAWVEAGAPYASLDLVAGQQAASGYYSPVKNALAGAPFADQLDYAATPVAFGTASAGSLVAAQQLRLVPAAGGYRVEVRSGSPFVETTTVTVTKAGGAPEAFPVTLDRPDGNLVEGLLIPSGDVGRIAVTSEETLFSTGASIAEGSPVASFELCRPGLEGCIGTGVLSREELTFTSTSISPTGEALTNVWTFGDGATVTTREASVMHAFARPGAYEVNLTVHAPSGRKSSAVETVVVSNRAPTILALDVSPATIYTDSTVRLRARASDADGGTLSYAWSLDGVQLLGETRASVTLSAAHLEAATGAPALAKRAYELAVSVSDGQQGVTTRVTSFTVSDRPTVVEAPTVTVPAVPDATYAVINDVVRVAVVASDADDAIVAAVARFESGPHALSVPLALNGTGAWVGETSSLGAMTYSVVVAATNAQGKTSESPSAVLEVRENAAPIMGGIRGPAVFEADEGAVFEANVTDPEGRALSYTWSLDGFAGEPGGATFALPKPGDSLWYTPGLHALRLSVVDANGQAGEDELAFAIDDFVAANVTVADARVDGRTVVHVRVTGVLGNPVAGATVELKDYYGPLPDALANATLVTDADGFVRWQVPSVLPAFDAALPFAHRLVVDVKAASFPTAPVQDVETDHVELAYQVSPLPYVPLPLP